MVGGVQCNFKLNRIRRFCDQDSRAPLAVYHSYLEIVTNVAVKNLLDVQKLSAGNVNNVRRYKVFFSQKNDVHRVLLLGCLHASEELQKNEAVETHLVVSRAGFLNVATELDIRRSELEAMADVWFFTKIPEAYGQTTISQDPIWAIHGNVIYIFKNGVWMGVSGGLATGGRTTVNGVKMDNAQQNERFAATHADPLNRSLSLRFFYINSMKTARGADFDFYNVSLQYTWGGGF